MKASADALKELPAVNGFIDDATKEIVYRNYVDISVAVSSPTGLVVPVLRNVEDMSFADIEKSIAGYAKRAKVSELFMIMALLPCHSGSHHLHQEGTLALEDMAGGTFTISNGGVFGSLMGTPIINPPQSAILGMHATKMRPVVVDGEVSLRKFIFHQCFIRQGIPFTPLCFFPQVVSRPMMYLALTYDHRMVDGREAVTFLKSIADKIEDPARLILDL